jgi:uncharacterized protein
MSRLVFWIGLVVLIVFAVRAKLRAAAARQRDASPPQQPRASIEDMTSCARCGLHFPASEALRVDGRDYCSAAHVTQPPAVP